MNHTKNGHLSGGDLLVALSSIVSGVVLRGLVKYNEFDTTRYAVNKSWFCTGVLLPFCVNVSLKFVVVSFFLFSPLEMCSSC